VAKAKQTLDIRIINCGGMSDLMSELESSFLVDALGLFRNRPDLGRGTPRAKVNLVRAYKAADFYGSAFSDADVLHIVGHSSPTELDVGYAKKRVKPSELGQRRDGPASHCRRSSLARAASSRGRSGERDSERREQRS
jgi:hypothetical protein